MTRAPRNRTLQLTAAERADFGRSLLRLHGPTPLADVLDRIVLQDCREVVPLLPERFVDLLVLDPPYNLDKQFGERPFRSMRGDDYAAWMEQWLQPMLRLLKPTASVYLCADWRSSSVAQTVLEKHLHLRNRITWEREKGRGALRNWKNCAEDVWFATMSDDYVFHVDDVKLRRRVLAPYRDANGAPKDWRDGYRDTFPSNLWTDLTVPFWSMPENTDHPTQKPEKLLAKLVLASSDPGAVVFDPFLGSGTTAVVAKKLGRRFVGIEIEAEYACLAQKRLALGDRSIQGYEDGVFWERNSQAAARAAAARGSRVAEGGGAE
ncbi:MAG: site-specific DNA-methyltransferase [Planctomycetes bacterium]|nr:site-specific DNA-methyltransferase [Planctomycetota bacterium]